MNCRLGAEMTKSIARTKRARLSRLGLAGSMLLFCACAVSPAISGLSSAGAPSAFGPPATSANPSPNPSETAAPQASYNEAEFWDRFGGTEMQSTFDSLSDIVAASDVVVV